MAILIVYVGFALSVSFVCSLLEATLLSAGRGMLSEESAAGRRGAAILLQLKEERIDDSISAILILNTMANTLGATMAGAQAAHVFGSSVIGVFSGVLTLLILVVSEIVPKTLGALHSRRLAGAVGYTLDALTWVMTPALSVSRLLTRLLAPSEPARPSKGELAAVIATAAKQGTLNARQKKLFDSLLRFDEIRVADVMTPRPMMVTANAESTVAELLGRADADAFSRIPIYAGDRSDDVVGYVLQRELLKAAAVGGGHERRLSEFQRPVTFLPANLSASAALGQLIERREALATVVDEHGGVDGVVTLEDLTETLLGAEIVDEFDRVVDLRQAALDLRDRRLERLRRLREPPATGGHAPRAPESK